MKRYLVTGHGQFPDDMLRYDRARIVKTTAHAEVGGRLRTFYLIEGATEPTVGRWTSFLWSVIQTDEQLHRWNLNRDALD